VFVAYKRVFKTPSMAIVIKILREEDAINSPDLGLTGFVI
jgi:hypothetical protein